MGDDLIGDLARVAADAGGIEGYGPVKAPRFLFGWGRRWLWAGADTCRRAGDWFSDAYLGCRCRWLDFLLCDRDFRLDQQSIALRAERGDLTATA